MALLAIEMPVLIIELFEHQMNVQGLYFGFIMII